MGKQTGPQAFLDDLELQFGEVFRFVDLVPTQLVDQQLREQDYKDHGDNRNGKSYGMFMFQASQLVPPTSSCP
ncbi:MAG: hypothetical protein CVV53_10015 [Spirochaetae bacterium HGW-Spirochaetae-9]|nr:MAG: hypothetical protein CVV53_10015 [Spirochaetae bacterium HGW-Spirochaetae-9]